MIKTSLPLIRINSSERAHQKNRSTRMWITHSPRSLIWLESIIELGLDQRFTKIYPRMVDGSDIAVIEASVNSELKSQHATPLQEILPNVWIPFDAKPSIPINHSDLEHLLLADITVILPNDNCIHLEKNNHLAVKDLLIAPERVSNQWSHGCVVAPIKFNIKSLHTPKPLSVDNYLDEAKGDIGTESISDLKPTPKGINKLLPKGLVGNSMMRKSVGVGGAVIGGVGVFSLSAFAKLLRMGSEDDSYGGSLDNSGPYKESFMERFEKWVQGKIENLKAKQENELTKLMDMFKDNPDEALKYALPLNGQEGRGLNPPSSFLDRQNTRFNIDAISASGAVSPWDVGNDNYFKLNQLYREAANREVQLGNFDRAAYIYAQLLGDQLCAAQVLEQGERYHEAALLYQRNKLELDAARNFVKSGDFTKALEIYQQHKKLEEIAKIYIQLGREEEANKVWRSEINLLIEDKSYVRAAEMMVAKFAEHQQAIALLSAQWPDSPQGLDCLKQEITLRERYQSEDELKVRIESLHQEGVGNFNYNDLSIVIGQSYHRAPAKSMKEFLEDQIRITTAYSIADRGDVVSKNLSVMKSIQADDSLMINDLSKIIVKHKTFAPIIESSKYQAKGSRVEGVTFVGASELPKQYSLITAAHLPDRELLIVSEGEKISLIGIRIAYNYLSEQSKTPIVANITVPLELREGRDIKLIIDKPNQLLLVNKPQAQIECVRIEETSSNGEYTLCGTANSNELCCCSNSSGQIVSLCYKEGSFLYLTVKNGKNIISTHHLDSLPEEFDQNLLKQQNVQSFIVSLDKAIYFAVGPLIGRFKDAETEWLYAGDDVLNVCVTPLGTKQRVAVTTTSMLICLWDSIAMTEAANVPIDRHVDTIFLPSGLLVSLSENGQSLSIRRTGYQGHFDDPSHFPVHSSAKGPAKKLIPYGRNKFIICYKDQLHLYTISEAS